ncbi:uncharacterized protein LOC108482686 [Gossypium arboreum]|uniref:Uncharacterized protein n=1 Tax=Gossypium arboreum TaxID=29729 RepID=A0ABR0PRN7_GOSAR|nr:uncharacterized protein LOC108482686 [Gossypium arboreum]KAK5827023.1 hypothetical protein PVK06_021958 [Gossypium arboreum]
MMARIPVRFNKIAAAFDEAARASTVVARQCESSSGSDHSSEDLSDLSDLVNSFIETDDHEGNKTAPEKEDDEHDDGSESEPEGYWSETKDALKRLVEKNKGDNVKVKIVGLVELACRNVLDMSSEDFKRRIMSDLRDNGFDAGLCKSRWEKFGRHPAGRHEYIDVNVNGTRYIIELNLGGEFEIARPTTSYDSLTQIFPRVFVCKPEELKQITRLMCKSMRESMKSKEMKVPPWRRLGYMQAKWFAHYKRTTNDENLAKNASKNVATATKRSVGFEELSTVSFYCRDGFVANSKIGLKVGYLSAAFMQS